MLLNSLQIEAVRGIRNRIELPLDASLTVLLAANGTAKTSVCDATEWLLTGRVRRLQSGLVPASELLNRYANNASAFVRANVILTKESRNIERTQPDNIRASGAGGTALDPLSTGEFLEQITPEYVGQTARSRNVEDQRAEWLRAVRFFNPDGLRLLLDDEADAERVRAIAFAELLGVGPVGRQIKNLQGVRTRIDSPRADLSAVRKQIATHRDKLKAEQTSVSAPYLSRVDSLLSEVASFLKFPLPNLLLKRRDVLLTLRDRLTSVERTSESQQAKYAQTKSAFPRYQTNLLTLSEWAGKQKPEFEKALSTAEKERDAARTEVTQLMAIASDRMNQLGKVNTTLGEAQTTVPTVATVRLNFTAHDPVNTFAVGRTQAERDNQKNAQEKSDIEFEQLKVFAEHFPGAKRNFLELGQLERQRLDLLQAIPTSEEQALIQRQLGDCNLSLAKLRTQLKATTTQSQHWVTEVKAQLPNWTDRSDCPLCGHNHATNEKLRDAITEALAQYPSSDANSARQLAELESTAQELQLKAATAAERQKQLLELEHRLASCREAHAESLASARGSGFDEQLFVNVDAPQIVAARLDAARRRTEAARAAVEQLSQTLAKVQDWHLQLQTIAERLHPVVPVNSLPGALAADPSLEERLLNVEALIAAVQVEAINLREKNEEAIKSAQQARTKLEIQESTIQQLRESFDPLEKTAANTKALVDEIEESWRIVSAASLNENSLTEVANAQREHVEQVRLQKERLQQAEQHLELAESAIQEETSRSEASKAIKELTDEERALTRVEALRTRLDAAIEQAQKNLSRLLTSQIRPLMRAISSFYLRTQGNAFIDSIGVDEKSDENVLRWLGELVDARPLSAIEMSQGQRQDLALSIFLARARRERGSFVLDEPLAHLDDLNRVAFFDTLRAMVAETTTSAEPFRMIVTTASRSLARHLRAKFFHIREIGGQVAFRILELAGDPRGGIEVHDVT